MITLACPLCGSPVKAPNSTPHIRLACRKCHTPFHMNRKGAAVVGEPPDIELDVEELKQKVREKVHAFPVAKVVGALGFLVVTWMVVGYLLRGNDELKPTAEKAARAFADGDVAYLKSLADDDSGDDVGRWYDLMHPNLLNVRPRWHGKHEVIEIGVGAEDQEHKTGFTAFSIHPALGNARDVSLSNPDQTTEGAVGAFDSRMDWVLNRSGHWKLNGHAMYAAAKPPPLPSPDPEPPKTARKK